MEFLLTLNFDNIEGTNRNEFEEAIQKTAAGEKYIITQWDCHSKQGKLGDKVYIILLGDEKKYKQYKRGIFASGRISRLNYTILKEVHENKEKKETRSVIDIELDAVTDLFNAKVLEMKKLKEISSLQLWSARCSGIEIKDGNKKLLEEWKQCVADKRHLCR